MSFPRFSLTVQLALLSDVHSNIHALEAVVSHLDVNLVDQVVSLGDAVGYNAHPRECLGQLRKLCAVHVQGNHDHAVATGETGSMTRDAATGTHYSRGRLNGSDLDFLANLQPATTLDVGGAAVHLFHASPRDALREYVLPTTAGEVFHELAARLPDDRPRLVALGHTHIPMVLSSEWVERSRLGDPPQFLMHDLVDREHPLVLMNPGSVGQPRDGDPRASFACVEVPSLEVKFRRIEYDHKAAAEAVTRAGLPAVLSMRLLSGK